MLSSTSHARDMRNGASFLCCVPSPPAGVAERGKGARMIVVSPSHDLRNLAESCVRDVYEQSFDARDLVLPDTLVAWLDDADRPLCVAGIRTAVDGFFSEAYLDDPVERMLSMRTGADVARESVFEITTLASRSPRVSSAFLRELAVFGKTAGFRWSFFTATVRLRKLLLGMGIPAFELSPANPARVAGAERWGSYYSQSPYVCAVNDQWLDADFLTRGKVPPHA